MPLNPPPRPLAADFADRLEALRKEAADLGHGDLDYIIEMAVQIADKRINVQGMEKVPDGPLLRRPVAEALRFASRATESGG